jgi:hypothetical protein
MRLLGLLGAVGIWQAANSLFPASVAAAALCTLGAAALGAWAIAVLRE